MPFNLLNSSKQAVYPGGRPPKQLINMYRHILLTSWKGGQTYIFLHRRPIHAFKIDCIDRSILFKFYSYSHTIQLMHHLFSSLSVHLFFFPKSDCIFAALKNIQDNIAHIQTMPTITPTVTRMNAVLSSSI